MKKEWDMRLEIHGLINKLPRTVVAGNAPCFWNALLFTEALPSSGLLTGVAIL